MADTLTVGSITSNSAVLTSNADNTFGTTVYVYLLLREGNFSGNFTALESSSYILTTYTLASGVNLVNANYSVGGLKPNTTYSFQWSMSRSTPLSSSLVDRRRPLSPPGTFTTLPDPPVFTQTISEDVVVGTPFSNFVLATNGPTYSIVSGSLPPGISLNASTGQVSGTPSVVDYYPFRVRATNAGGFAEIDADINVLSAVTAPAWVDNTLSGDLRVGIAYSDGVSASGTTPTYSVSAGSLPPGITLNSSTGAVTGTPTAQGSYSFTLKAENAGGNVTQAFTLVVKPGGFRWDGSAWVRITTLKRYDGSAWVDVTQLRRWDGSNWVNANL
jgi:hypothetical protein